MKSALQKLNTLLRREGVWGAVRNMAQRALRAAWLRRCYLFVLDGDDWTTAAIPADLERSVFTRSMALPEDFLAEFGATRLNPDAFRREMNDILDRDGELWIYRRNGKAIAFACTYFYKTPRAYRVTYLKEDVNSHSVEVLPEARGASLQVVMLKDRLNYYIDASKHRYYLEVFGWNIASLKSVVKVGFESLGARYTLQTRRGKWRLWRPGR